MKNARDAREPDRLLLPSVLCVTGDVLCHLLTARIDGSDAGKHPVHKLFFFFCLAPDSSRIQGSLCYHFQPYQVLALPNFSKVDNFGKVAKFQQDFMCLLKFGNKLNITTFLVTLQKKKGKVENGSKVNKPFEEEQSNLKSRVNIHKSPVHWKQGSIQSSNFDRQFNNSTDQEYNCIAPHLGRCS